SDLNSQSRWASGFRVETGYYFGNGHDVTVNWTYFSKNSRRTVFPVNSPLLVADELLDNGDEDEDDHDDLELIANNFPTKFPSAERVKSTFNAVNLEFGQMAYWGEQVKTRFHVGLQYASIVRQRSHYNSTITAARNFSAINLDFNATKSSAADFEQKFNGIGPRLGLDTFYKLGDSNFSLVGKAAIALLASSSQVRKGVARININEQLTVSNQSPMQLFAVNADITIPNAKTRTLTAGLEAKLGFEYAHPLASGDLIFEGGYQWVLYPQSMLNPTAFSLQKTSDDIDGELLEFPAMPIDLGIPGDLNNFGYHGLYVGLRWEGDLA
ncbi:MAG: hypothetical protein GKR77_07190, partial [Legionellales bacterium]|nr:hypothetical protein [Legionellales bacterium]